MRSATTDWDSLDQGKYADEDAIVRDLLASPPLDAGERALVEAEAIRLVRAARRSPRRQGVVEGFLKEFSLGTQEGLALMCLAEALLRTPDAESRAALVAEKIGPADWASHLGASDSLFVNASTWGLMLTGRLVEVEDAARHDLAGWLRRLTARLGEPLVRQAIVAAVRMMGEQFVLGQDIGAALARARREGLVCSFDMLGEGARTAAAAARYERLYADAIEAIGRARGAGLPPEDGHGVSVKLSALSPRYVAVQETRLWADLYPRLRRLALLAARHNLNLAIDAEEADRLIISLKLVERLAREPELGGWTGLGIVVQAYQKRALAVIAGLGDLARSSGRRLMVRLVKGAYWDAEIKQAQVAGRSDYPVFTTKAATDVHYLACARALVAASPALFPQFATHNAHSLAAVRHMARTAGVRMEHQRLHGMGEALYEAAALEGSSVLRVYAPVGSHEDLLPYLVRRLLENGANSSFVHALLDETVPAEAVAADPLAALIARPGRNPRLPMPADLYGAARRNPVGRDYSRASERRRAEQALAALSAERLEAGPIIEGRAISDGIPRPVTSPADRRRTIGHVVEVRPEHVEQAVAAACAAQPAWDRLGGIGRGRILRAMGDRLEAAMDPLVALLAAETGRTLNDGVAEVREAVDFCRYYADLAERQFAGPVTLNGPAGERNLLELRGRGTFACISPWNFPLSIFTGQLAAALAAGNAVIAKPAEQTPLVAAMAVRLFLDAGLPSALLSLLPGEGATVGAALVAHPGIDGVAFTGGTDTARTINQALAARSGPILPFIAETGGLNGLFVDTTALTEQVVDDVLSSAFGSAGQRCSALRLLLLPEETADDIIATLIGAMDALVIGDPADPATDVGPVIDEDARAALADHVARLDREGRIIHRLDPGRQADRGSFFGPVLAAVPSATYLDREVFGPVLHVCRYPRGGAAQAARDLASRGYGLTLGVHSRLDHFAEQIRALVPAGNVYVNRSIIGAVVGVQPFGGEGLSGTGPKAGGPHALLRYAVERAVSVNISAQGGDPALLNI